MVKSVIVRHWHIGDTSGQVVIDEDSGVQGRKVVNTYDEYTEVIESAHGRILAQHYLGRFNGLVLGIPGISDYENLTGDES